MGAALLDRVLGAGAGALFGLPGRVQLRLAGGEPTVIDGETLDPALQLMLRLAALRGSGTLISAGATDPVAERRRVVLDGALAQGPRTEVGTVAELVVDGGADPVPARHYAPIGFEHGAARPLLVFAHGGGWVVGGLDTHDELCRLLCRHADVHVVSVDYRLGPEHPFPAGLEDVIAATRWALREAGSLGADARRVAVGGDSAGGNLSAAACQALAADGVVPALQVLIYPSVALDWQTRSKELFAEGFFLDARSRAWCESRYVGPEVDRSDPRLSPLRGSLSGLPPAVVLTAAFDPLRDEGEAYAAALREAGGHVIAYRVAGMIHGFANMTGINRAARDAVLCLAGIVRAELAPSRA